MRLLDNITTGKTDAPPRLLIVGTAGIGKSTLAAAVPGVVFLPTEDGLNRINCDKFPLAKTYADVVAAMADLYNEEHKYTALAVDTVDWLGQIINEQVCADNHAKTVAEVGGGFGKGSQAVTRYWRHFAEWLATLHTARRMTIVLLAHATVERFQDPEGPAYDRYTPRLHKDATTLLTEWVDAVLFATSKVRVEVKKEAFGKERAVAHPVGADGGERILRCIGGPACVAKNRYGFPAELPLSWPAVKAAIDASAS